MKWSKEQEKAIYDAGKDILVNAGAGSGKTAVLTERLVQKIEEGIKIDELIILTFTNLAAGEMKDRLRNKLAKSTTKYAKEALLYLDQANIQTFDAFVNELVRKYHYLLNISSKINLVDDLSFKMISLDLLTEIFIELYAKKDVDFFLLLNAYTTKDDENIKNELLDLYHKMVIFPGYEELLKNTQELFSDGFIQKVINNIIQYLTDIKTEIAKDMDKLILYTASSKLNQHYQTLLSLLKTLNECESYDDYLFLNNYSFAKLPTYVEYEEEKEPYKMIYGEIKNLIDKIKDMLIYKSKNELINLYLSTKPCLNTISYILLRLDYRLKNYKKAHNAYDFNDIAQMAITLLETNESLRRYIQYHTKEILIDEYQDTSDIQEKLISLIANHNVYMVGDVKQSIYRFRNANPDIFKKKYNALLKDGIIDLTKNFRSRKEVLSFVNLVFENLMSERLGGVGYDDAHALNYGLTSYDSYFEASYEPKIYTYKEDDEKKFSKAEIEAFLIAKKIKEFLQTKKIVDKESKTYRSLQYRDIAILTSAKDKYDLYKKIFEYEGIPLQIYKDQDFIAGGEIYAIYNLIKVIYCLYDEKFAKDNLKKALTSVLRSFIVQMSDDDITSIVISQDSLMKLKEIDWILYQKLQDTKNQIGKITLYELIEYIYQTFDIYQKMMTLSNVEKAEATITYMYEIINNLMILDYTLLDVINYFTLLINQEEKFAIKMSQKKQENSHAVKMMSIHASKGLEFSICFFPELYKEFNFQDLNKKFIYSKEYQIILPISIDGMLLINPLKLLEKNNYRKEEISEKIRLLYVALTRAKEQIILVMPKINVEASLDLDIESSKMKANSFFDLLFLIWPKLVPFEQTIELSSLSLSKDYIYTNIKNKIDTTKYETLPFAFFDTTLKKRSLVTYKASKESTDFKDKKGLELLQMGLEFHKALELSEMSYETLNRLQLTEKVKKEIIAFLKSDFIQSKKIINHYHEYAFYDEEDGNAISGSIDLVLDTADAIYIIDYKLQKTLDVAYIKQLLIYKNYIQKLTSKKVYTYLYSIFKHKFKEVTF